MDIIMVRHGESQDNRLKKYSSKDTGLTKEARRELGRTKKLLEEFSYDKVYVSPLLRARETMELLGLDGLVDTRIREVDFGEFAGHDFESLTLNYKKELDYWLDNYLDHRPLGGESVKDLYQRVEEFLEEKLAQNEDILLVTHDGVIKSVLGWVFDRYDYFFRFKLDNGSISVVSLDDGFKFIKKLNYI